MIFNIKNKKTLLFPLLLIFVFLMTSCKHSVNHIKIIFSDWVQLENYLYQKDTEQFNSQYQIFIRDFNDLCSSSDYADYFSVYFDDSHNYFEEFIDSVKTGIENNDYDLIRLSILEFNFIYENKSSHSSAIYIITIHILVVLLLIIFIFLYIALKKYEKECDNLEQLGYYATFTMKTIEKERRRISKELHDSVLQDLKVLELQLSNQDSSKEEISKGISNSIKQIRNICQNLTPSQLKNVNDTNELISSLHQLCEVFEKETNIKCTFTIQNEVKIQKVTLNQSLMIFRIVQEALNNIQKHSKAQNVTVLIRNPITTEDKVVIFITDDGIGFNVSDNKNSNHFGLNNMKERAVAIGGELFIESDKEVGTEIKLVF